MVKTNFPYGISVGANELTANPVQDAINDVDVADATAAVGEAPTAEEFDAVVDLANANKAAINLILEALRGANIISEE